MALVVKSPPTNAETQICSLGWEDALAEGMATHSRILAWRIPWTEKPGGLQSTGLQRVGRNLSNSSQGHKEDIIMFVLFYAELFCLDQTGLSRK